jgi:hypothetical protein
MFRTQSYIPTLVRGMVNGSKLLPLFLDTLNNYKFINYNHQGTTHTRHCKMLVWRLTADEDKYHNSKYPISEDKRKCMS